MTALATETASPKASATVELALFAPYNKIVQIMGSWNDWQPQGMTRGDDGWWRIGVDLPDGEHHYKFRVRSLSYFCKDQMVDVFDPYALSITEDSKENAILRIKNGQRQWVDYQWRHDAAPLPANGELIIYEMHVGDFAGNGKRGTFNDVLARLDYLEQLGINCLELMPVKEFPGEQWGYSLKSLFAVENSYGAPEDLCRVVDECHARGIRVIIDGVYNHTHHESPLTRIDYEYWFYRENPDPPEMQWGPKFDFGHHDVHLDIIPARKYVLDSLLFWVEKFHIDGIRFDATRALCNFDTLKALADAAYSKINGLKHFMTVAEHVPEDPSIAGRGRGAPMDAAWRDSIGKYLQAICSRVEQAGRKPDDLDGFIRELNPATNGYGRADRVVNFIANHDQRRAMNIIAGDGKFFDEAAFRRMKLGTALLITAPGLPMLWMGQEFGFAAEKSEKPVPLDWSLLEHPLNQDLLRFHQGLLNLRKHTPALQGETFEVLLHDNQRQLLVFKRWNAEGNVVVVAANLKDEFAGEFSVQNPSLEDGQWHEYIHNYDIEVAGNTIKDTLAESEVKVFIRK